MSGPKQPTFAGAGQPARAGNRTLRCRLVAKGASRPQTHMGVLPPVDMHQALGLVESADAATTSTLLLANLGACLFERIRANAAIGGISVRHLELGIEAEMSASPLWGGSGREPKAVGLEAIQVSVHMDADAPEAALRALVNHAVLWSPVANTLHAPIHLDVALVPMLVS